MKLYIEDLICRLAGTGNYLFSTPIQVWHGDSAVVQSISQNPSLGKGYSEKQRALVLRLCKKYKDALAAQLGPDVYTALDNPEFKFTLIQAAPQERSITVVNKEIIVKFPFNDSLVEKLRKYRDTADVKTVRWDPDNRFWAMAMEEQNVLWLKNNLITDDFSVDEEFEIAYSKISEILEKIEDFVPMLVEDNGQYRFVNTHTSVPQPETTDLIKAMLLAKYYGISVWDEKVSKLLESGNFSPILMDFLNETKPNSLEFDSSEYSLDHFTELFNHNVPALIIVPPGSELETLKSWYNWLRSKNFTEKDISVMFRLDNANGATFNELIKSAGLNNPITENTKVVFVSQKIPKPLIKSGIDFKIIVNLGSLSGVHYSLTTMLSDRLDVIKYTNKKKTGYQFGLL